MLKLRVATALVLAAMVLVVVLFLPLAWMAAFFHLVVLVAAYEWARLAGVETRLAFVAYAAALSVIVALLWLFPAVREVALLAAAVFWLMALFFVATYPASGRLLGSTPLLLAGGAVALCGAWLALVVLRAATGSHGEWSGALQIIWLLVAVTLADSGAYFAGHRFGRRKLAAKLSPGKTVEGALGGAAGVLVWALGGAVVFDGGFGWWLAIGIIVFAASVVGDLFESALKRLRGVKDSGGVLPGHGGLLDRVDSLLAAAPVFAVLGAL